MTRTVLFAIPTYNHQIDIRTMGSLIEGGRLLKGLGIDWGVTYVGGCSIISVARNQLVANFLETENATDLFFIDADLAFPPENLVRTVTIAHDRDVVAGAYPKKMSTPTFPIHVVEKDGKAVVDQNGMIEMKRVGTGFMLIRRHVLEKMAKIYPWDQSRPNNPPCPVIFDFKMTDEGYVGEDFTFCDRAREHGFKIWTDPFLEFSHIGECAYTARLCDHIR